MSRNIALITGSSGGLGEHLALGFAAVGYDIILHGRNLLRLLDVRGRVIDRGANCEYVQGDLRNQDTINRLISLAQTNGLDTLVNNAGIYLSKPMAETTSQDLDNLMRVNLYAPFLLTSGMLPMFLSRGSGTIVNINSFAGKSGGNLEAAYSASKHALVGMSDSLKLEVTKRGLRVLDVYLGAMKTDMSEGRQDSDMFIDPADAASQIVEVCHNPRGTLTVRELVLGRKTYRL